MDEEKSSHPENAPEPNAKPVSMSDNMGDRITKGCLGCGCFSAILLIIGLIVSYMSAGEASAEATIGGGVKFALIIGGGIVIVILVFFLMRLDMVMAKFKN